MFRSNKGSALVQVIIVMAVFAILGTALISLSTTEYMQSEQTNQETQAYYYAKSGVEMARRLFEKNFAAYSAKTQFYLYGDLGSNIEIKDTAGTGQIAASIINTPRASDPSTHDITISSTGTYNSKQKNVIYKFSYTVGGMIGEPVPPSTEPGGPAVSGGPTVEGGIDWYDGGGILDSGGGTSTKPVVFNAGTGEYIYKKNNTNPPFYAPAMYFKDLPVSLVVRENMNLDLYSNFISFKGDVDGEEANNVSHYGLLTLHVNGSLLDGASIGGTAGTRYGVIYIGTKVRNSTHILLGNTQAERGYYYFPNGINLTRSTDIGRLIKINDINTAYLDGLGVAISTNGGVSSGIYQ